MTLSTYLWRAGVSTRLVAGDRGGYRNQRDTIIPDCYKNGFPVKLFENIAQSGKPLAAWNHDQIFEVMSRTRVRGSPVLSGGNDMFPNAAFSLLTTVPDYAAFLSRLVAPRGEAFDLKPATHAEFMKPHSRVNSALSWGLGMCVEREAERTYLWQWGSIWDCYYHFVLVYPESQSAIVVFTNGINGLRVAERIARAASGHESAAFLWI
jgi:hypothetical protein